MFKTAVKGAAWTTVSTIVRSVVSLLQVSILTRFLDKADFGIVAIATLFIGFTGIFLDLGISIGILHKQEISKNEYSSLFWLNIFTGMALTIILVLIAPIVGYAYNDLEITPIIQLLCLNMLFTSIGNQHRTVQQKKLRFKLISFVEIISSLLTIVVAVYTAYTGYGVYSLVYSALFATLFPNLLFLLIGLYKDNNIFLHFAWKETLPYLKIGGFNVAAQVMDYFSREIDIVIISATLGKETLGVYSLCKKLVVALYSSITPIYNKVLVPLLSRIQNDIDQARGVVYDIIETVSLTNIPVFLLIAIFPGIIIHYLYGDNFLDGIYVLSLLAIHYGYLSPSSPASCIQVAFGRTDVGFYWTIFRIIIYASSAYLGSLFSIEGMVMSIFICSLLSSPLGWKITVEPIIGGRFFDYFTKSFYPFIVELMIALPFYLFLYKSNNLFVVIVSGIAYLTVYIFIAYILFKKSYIVSKLDTFKIPISCVFNINIHI